MNAVANPRTLAALLALVALLAAPPARAAGGYQQDPEATSTLDLPLHVMTLDNGLRLIVSPSPTATAVAVVLVFAVGSRDEVPGQSGFAHLFEHMMFQGSAHAPKGEHSRLLAAVGGESNALTAYDMTQYHSLVPPEHLPLALWLEAERLRSLTLTEETLRNQVAAVREELRERVENAAYVPGLLRLQQLVFSNWANAHPVIGDHDDIERASLATARAFFARHYAPNNATLVIAGAVEPSEAAALVERYFAGLPAQERPPRPDTAEPERTEPVEERLEDAHARTPALFLSVQTPPRDAADYHAVSLLADVLAGGESSRLYRRLVKEEQLAAAVWAGQDGRLGPDMLTIGVVLTGSHLARTREVIAEELARLSAETVPAAELDKVRRQKESAFVFALRTALGRARLLARLALVRGEPTRLSTELQRFLAVTPDDIRRVTQEYFAPERRVVLEIVPRGRAAAHR